MRPSKFLAVASLVALVALTIYQLSGESAAVQNETAKGKFLIFLFLASALGTWFTALGKAWNRAQFRWLLGIFLFWPAMYLYIFRYARAKPLPGEP